MMMNYATLVYYARLGAKAALAECDQNIMRALAEHDSESFTAWNREMAYTERLIDAFNEIWNGLNEESDAKKAAFLAENRET